MILMIDNYDSFVFNLVRYLERLGQAVVVRRNDQVTLEEIKALSPEAIVISPGPRAPRDSGIIIDVIKTFGADIPILGVCLGHQAIGEAYGGETVRAIAPVHGKASVIEHDGSGLFKNLPVPLTVGRYHSLVAALPEQGDLVVTALSADDEIMAMHHKAHPVYGIQFHPESILTPDGIEVMRNFLTIVRDWHTEQRFANDGKEY